MSLLGSPIPEGACWSAAGALAVLRTEALSNDGAVFLATHTPVERFEVQGLESATVRDRTERGLLDALSATSRRHAFAVVQGEPGSGKSHLIRWLAEMWPEGRDVPVLLRRAEASLEGSLRGLREAIPSKYRDVVGEIEVRQSKAQRGRIADFVSNLYNSLDPDYFERPLADRQFCSEFAPGEILRVEEVRSAWKAPERIVNLMSGAAGDGTAGGRNSESATFTIYEIANLTAFERPVSRASAKAGKLLQRIDAEMNVIEEAERAGVPAEKLVATARDKVRHAAMLTDALNVRRNHAIQNSLGVTADKLKGIFLNLRRALLRDGRRLVILLEDITAWEGVDDSLIDVLVIDATTALDLCDQVTVVGVTPYYYQRLKGNYVQRITHDIRLGDAEGGLQDVANLREAEVRARFVATYLRAVRAGVDGIGAWKARHATDPTAPVPNQCDDCPFGARARCHAAFGSRDGVGLYPFSDRSVEALFGALKPQDHGMTWRTPRGIIQGILAPTMTRPEALSSRTYPTREIEAHTGIDRAHTYVYGVAQSRIENRIPDKSDRDRARRMLALWGDPRGSQTSRNQGGDLEFAEVPATVFDTFGIPWLGDRVEGGPEAATPDDPGAEDLGTGHPEAPHGAEGDRGPVVEDGPGAMRAPRPPVATRPARPTAGPPPRGPVRAPKMPPQAVAEFQREIQAFKEGGLITKPYLWNEIARELLGKVSISRLDVDATYFDLLFKENRIKVSGTSKVDRSTQFELPTEEWLVEGLDAYAQFRITEYFGAEPPRSQDVIRRRITRCLRHMEELTRAHIDRMTPRTGDGSPWCRITTITQVLAVRAWLRGDVRPTAGLADQLRAILRDEAPSTTDRRSRVDSWNSILKASDHAHETFRAHVAGSLRLAQGEGRQYGLTDAAVPVAAIASLQSEFRLAERPGDWGDLAEPVFAQLKGAADAASGLGRLPGDEYERLRMRAQRIDDRRRDNGIADHLSRVEAAVTRADAGLPPLSKVAGTGEWLRSKKAILDWDRDGVRIGKVEDCLAPLLSEAKPEKRLKVLDLVSVQPASDLEAIHQAMEGGERLVEAAMTALADYVGSEDKPTRTIEDIRAEGAGIAATVGKALEAWRTDA